MKKSVSCFLLSLLMLPVAHAFDGTLSCSVADIDMDTLNYKLPRSQGVTEIVDGHAKLPLENNTVLEVEMTKHQFRVTLRDQNNDLLYLHYFAPGVMSEEDLDTNFLSRQFVLYVPLRKGFRNIVRLECRMSAKEVE